MVRTITDLKLNSAGQTTPVKLLPGAKSYPFTFIVGVWEPRPPLADRPTS